MQWRDLAGHSPNVRVQQLQRTQESRYPQAPLVGAEQQHGSFPARDAPPGEAALHKGS